MTRASWLIASGVPSAILCPKSSATMRSQVCRISGTSCSIDEHADPAPARHLADDAAELGRFVGVEAGGGLVEQEHGRFGHERARDADEARDTVRQRRRSLVEHVAELELLDDLVHERVSAPAARAGTGR